MFQTPDGEDLLQAFFTALDQRDLEQCAAIEARVRTLSATLPSAVNLADYMLGILANERDRDYAVAEGIFRGLCERDGVELPLKGRLWLALGRTYEYQGNWECAIAAYKQCEAIFTELNQPIDLVKTWKHLAIAHNDGFTKGDLKSTALETAIDYCNRARDMLDRVADTAAGIIWLRGSVWNTLGLIYRNFGRWDEAIAAYERDLEICKAIPDKDNQHGIGTSMLNLGEIYHRQGTYSWTKARRAYNKALRIFRDFNDRYLEAETLANLGYLYDEQRKYKQALGYYKQAIGILEELRAGVSAEEARAGFFTTIVDTYTNAVLVCWKLGRARQAFDYVELSRSRAFLDLLAAGSSDLAREFGGQTLSLAQVRARLPADALLLEYFVTGLTEVHERSPADRVPRRHRFPKAHVLIFAVTHAGGVSIHDTGISPDTLRPTRLNNVAERHFLQPDIRSSLYSHLIAPVEPLLHARRTVYLIPHGPLHYIPFQALIDGNSAVLLREDGPAFVYAPSASILFREPRHADTTAQAPCLAVGYNGGAAEQLRFAEDEAQHIARLTGGEVLAGPQPKKEAIYASAEHYRLLLIACHGTFNPKAPLRSALQLGPAETLTALDVIEHLRLRCDLVTLSACESGLSRVRRGDELIGLVRAFIYAGASTLLCTLWRVDDRSTRILIERFYQEILDGTPFADALKRAQLYLMQLSHQQVEEIERRLSGGSDLPEAQSVGDQKGITSSPLSDASAAPGALEGDEPVFADPFYWAPFFLTGYAAVAMSVQRSPKRQ